MVTRDDNVLHYLLTALLNIVRKTQKTVDISESWYYHRLIKYEQRRLYRNGSFVRYGSLTREWGKVTAKAPHEPIPCALRKLSVGESQSLGAILRRQGMHPLEARVGKPTVSSECCFQNGYGDVLYG